MLALLHFEKGGCVHEQIIKSGWDLDEYVRSNLVGIYSKCGSMDDVQRVFNKIPFRGGVIWNAMI
jgi:hypothetical protein